MAPSIVSTSVELSQDEKDERDIAKLFSYEGGEDVLASIVNNPNSAPDLEKADDAVNYSDISDDDLPEEEDGSSPDANGHDNDDDDLADFLGDTSMPMVPSSEANGDIDDLFGEAPAGGLNGKADVNGMDMSFDFEDDAPLNHSSATIADLDLPGAMDLIQGNPKNAYAVTQELIDANFDLPEEPEDKDELLARIWPMFKKQETPFFSRLLPSKRAQYIGKTPLKQPKALLPTKLALEIMPDHEKLFRMPPQAISKKKADIQGDGLVRTAVVQVGQSSANEATSNTAEEGIAGFSWTDLQLACEDWEAAIEAGPIAEAPAPVQDEIMDDDDWEREMGLRPTKKQKISHSDNLFTLPINDDPAFEDFESATRKIASTIELNLNDPKLLVESYQPKAAVRARRGLNGILDRRGTGNLMSRYNVANDEAYDLLKENHQNKIRSQLGHMALDHSLPAVRLQYPYYKTRLSVKDARLYHRPIAVFKPNEIARFKKLGFKKRKHLKGKDAQHIFATAKDLTLADNSNVILLEYAEECPIVMSNFGMQSRIINYYRRKGPEDKYRPKSEIGETGVLMPQDKSPLSIFGTIAPGDVLPTLHNGLFRAPIFMHKPKSTDFLLVRNTTGVDGSTWHIRNMETLHLVGQNFPSVDVPGPHSRKVTTAAKNRLKMITFRKIKKNKNHRIAVSEITKHFPDSSDLQNRQKLKEFMAFSKEFREWEMKPGEVAPDEVTLRSMVKPEDVCLLDAMQVGVRNLADSGFGNVEEINEDDEQEGESFEQQMAPWNLTRNFIHATQGKAMLQLHGDGDPSGRGEAFNFIRTSMKGGFKPIGESVEDKLDAAKLKALGGHSYNVARQQKAYEEGIKQIWNAQARALSSTVEPEEAEGPRAVDDDGHDDHRASTVGIPATSGFHRDDDAMSQFSRMSTASQRGKVLKLIREKKGKHGNIERKVELISDPRVIREYVRRRRLNDDEGTNIRDLKPSGDAEIDRRNRKRIEEELARLERNKERRIARDKQKGIFTDDGDPETAKIGTTQRKCANCGQVGHIKTNKKLCPMLNGTMAPPASAGGFASSTPVGFGPGSLASAGGATPTPTSAIGTPAPNSGGETPF